MSKLVGFKKFTGKKDGTKYCVLQVVGEFNAREKNNGCAGQKVEEVLLLCRSMTHSQSLLYQPA